MTGKTRKNVMLSVQAVMLLEALQKETGRSRSHFLEDSLFRVYQDPVARKKRELKEAAAHFHKLKEELEELKEKVKT